MLENNGIGMKCVIKGQIPTVFTFRKKSIYWFLLLLKSAMFPLFAQKHLVSLDVSVCRSIRKNVWEPALVPHIHRHKGICSSFSIQGSLIHWNITEFMPCSQIADTDTVSSHKCSQKQSLPFRHFKSSLEIKTGTIKVYVHSRKVYEAIKTGWGWLTAEMKERCSITTKAICGKYTPKPWILVPFSWWSSKSSEKWLKSNPSSFFSLYEWKCWVVSSFWVYTQLIIYVQRELIIKKKYLLPNGHIFWEERDVMKAKEMCKTQFKIYPIYLHFYVSIQFLKIFAKLLLAI